MCMTNYFRCKSTPVNVSIVHILKKTIRHDSVFEYIGKVKRIKYCFAGFGLVKISNLTPNFYNSSV